MSIVKFATGYSADSIKAVEVIRESDACVWVPSITSTSGRREAKLGTFTQYHDTWELAHTYLIESAESEVNSARRQLEKVNGKLGNIKGMKPPSVPA